MKKENTLQSFFNLDDFSKWKKEWVGMPEFIQEDLLPVKQLIVNFATKEDFEEFAKLVNQKLTSRTKFIWHPIIDYTDTSKTICIDEE